MKPLWLILTEFGDEPTVVLLPKWGQTEWEDAALSGVNVYLKCQRVGYLTSAAESNIM